ncbi:MAG: non-ribosomal peptide synthetase, partial [bacterium]|nr:non-ribosomal peptide synthetase [bacterium]
KLVADFLRQHKEVKEHLRRIPHNGIGYGIREYLTQKENTSHTLHTPLEDKPGAAVSFNYLGQFDSDVEGMSFEMAKEKTGGDQSPLRKRTHELDITGIISGQQLAVSFTYNKNRCQSDTIDKLARGFERNLKKIITYCASRKEIEYSPSDFTYSELSVEALENLLVRYPLEEIYPLTPMQEGMLFNALYDKNSTAYFEQMSYRLQGQLEGDVVKKSLDKLFQRYDILRTAFWHEIADRPLQAVLKSRDADFQYEDLRTRKTAGEKDEYIAAFKIKDRKRLLDLEKDALMRVTLMRAGENEYEFIWSFHHILMDGWCTGILILEFFEIYKAILDNQKPNLPAVTPYRNYIRWLEQRNQDASGEYWKNYLAGFDGRSEIPRREIPAPFGTYKAQQKLIVLNEEKTIRLTQLAAVNKATLNTTFQTLWGILMAKYTGKNDVLFGAVVSGRPSELEGFETMVGLFINTVPVRVCLPLDKKITFNRLLQSIQKDGVESEPHHYYPLAEIQAQSEAKQNLIDHIIVFENYPLTEQLEGVAKEDREEEKFQLEISNLEVYEQTDYDLNIAVAPAARLTIRLDYNAAQYSGETITSVANSF